MERAFLVPKDISLRNLNSQQLQELHGSKITPSNADIVVMKSGEEKLRVPATQSARNRWKPKLIPVKVRTYTREGMQEKTLGEERQPELKKGFPFVSQVILNQCDYYGSTLEEILDVFFEELNWFPRDKIHEESIKTNIQNLLDRDLLMFTDGRYHRVLKESFDLDEEQGYDITPNIFPVFNLIRDSAEQRIHRTNLVRLIHSDWYSVQEREGAKYWVDKALEKGYIREVENRVYEANKRLPEPYYGGARNA